MASVMVEQAQESSGSTPPETRQAVDMARQVHTTRPPVGMTPDTQLDMPPWEPSTGNLNINLVEPPPRLPAEGPRGPPQTLPQGPPVRPLPHGPTSIHCCNTTFSIPLPATSLWDLLISILHVLAPSVHPQHSFGLLQSEPGASQCAHPTSGYAPPLVQPIPVASSLHPFPRPSPVSSGRNPQEPPNMPLTAAPAAPSQAREKSVSNLQGHNLEPEFNEEDSEHSTTVKSVERSVSHDNSQQS